MDVLHTCTLCGDPTDAGDEWCASCAVDVEIEIDEICDGPKPEND